MILPPPCPPLFQGGPVVGLTEDLDAGAPGATVAADVPLGRVQLVALPFVVGGPGIRTASPPDPRHSHHHGRRWSGTRRRPRGLGYRLLLGCLIEIPSPNTLLLGAFKGPLAFPGQLAPDVLPATLGKTAASPPLGEDRRLTQLQTIATGHFLFLTVWREIAPIKTTKSLSVSQIIDK